MNVIEMRGVRKAFGEIQAVDGLDLDVPPGICLGLLGPNGAGKSTSMRLLTGQAIADEGEITVLGHPLPAQAKIARGEMGVVPQLDNLDVSLTVEQNLLVFAHLYRVPRCDRKEAVERALADLDAGLTGTVEQDLVEDDPARGTDTRRPAVREPSSLTMAGMEPSALPAPKHRGPPLSCRDSSHDGRAAECDPAPPGRGDRPAPASTPFPWPRSHRTPGRPARPRLALAPRPVSHSPPPPGW